MRKYDLTAKPQTVYILLNHAATNKYNSEKVNEDLISTKISASLICINYATFTSTFS